MRNKAIELCPITAFGPSQEGTILVDMRERDGVTEAAYDLPDILNIPFSGFKQRFTEPPKDKEVIMGCRSRNRGSKAAYFLFNHSYAHVVDIQHGILQRTEKGSLIKNILQPTATNACDCSNPNCC